MKKMLTACMVLGALLVCHGVLAIPVTAVLCLNADASLSCQQYVVDVYSAKQELSVQTTINHTYPVAGIKFITPGYSLKGSVQNQGGYYLFQASQVPQTLVVSSHGSNFNLKKVAFHDDSAVVSRLHNQTTARSVAGHFFHIESIIHPVSMNVIQVQEATIGSAFSYNFIEAKAMNYYDENKNAGVVLRGEMPEDDLTRLHQLGLEFDPNQLIISGVPNAKSSQRFSVGITKNSGPVFTSTDFSIDVGFNKKDIPIYKTHYHLPSAIPTENYQMNLMNLLEENAGFAISNQVSFRIVDKGANASWLNISRENSVMLEGVVPLDAAGTEAPVTIIAHSNTGGDTDHSLTIKIPVALAPQQKPSIDYFTLEQAAGTLLQMDLSSHIQNPMSTRTLKVVLDNIESEINPLDNKVYDVPNLSISEYNPMLLEGFIAQQLSGQKYYLTFHAHTDSGGDSESIRIPLQISINSNATPRFREAHPCLPMLYPGQKYFFDFAADKSIEPEYEEAAYEIRFAEGFVHPEWLALEHNQLRAERVPDDLDSSVEIAVLIKNTPGGSSKVLPLSLVVMN